MRSLTILREALTHGLPFQSILYNNYVYEMNKYGFEIFK